MSVRLTAREALRLLWEADCYPRLGNADWAIGAELERAALAKSATAMTCPDDPPEFAQWLRALQRPSLPENEREEIYGAIYDYFEREGE